MLMAEHKIGENIKPFGLHDKNELRQFAAFRLQGVFGPKNETRLDLQRANNGLAYGWWLAADGAIYQLRRAVRMYATAIFPPISPEICDWRTYAMLRHGERFDFGANAWAAVHN